MTSPGDGFGSGVRSVLRTGFLSSVARFPWALQPTQQAQRYIFNFRGKQWPLLDTEQTISLRLFSFVITLQILLLVSHACKAGFLVFL